MSELVPCKKCGKTDIGFIENKAIFTRSYFCSNGCNNRVTIEHHISLGYPPPWEKVAKEWNEANAK